MSHSNPVPTLCTGPAARCGRTSAPLFWLPGLCLAGFALAGGPPAH